MRSFAVIVALAATAVTAQVANYTSSLNMTVDPNSVPQQQRAVWCQAQTNTCGDLCDSNTNENSCTQADLSYQCTCSSNNSAPGLQFYTQTMPTFICQELFSQCIAQNAGNQDGQSECKSNIEAKCGTVDPPSGGDDSSSSTTAAPSATGSGSGSHTTSAAAAAKTSGSAAPSSTSHGLAGPTLAPAGTGAVAVAAVGLLAYFL